MGSILDSVASELAVHGLILRGGFNFETGEGAPADEGSGSSPPAWGRGAERSEAERATSHATDANIVATGPSGAPAKSVLLVGQSGAATWPHFMRWRKTQPADLNNPLDTWSRVVIGDVAQKFGARAVSPSDRPYLPFQQWAMRAEGLKPSPLGILMHPEYGLWHAWRGALLFDVEIAIQAPRAVIHLCDLCDGKPCLKACPVGAHSASGFAYQDCLSHVRGPQGEPCRSQGCLDRNACPYGTAYRYPAEMQAFHMAAFARV